jgi:hypothetical protein
MVDETEFPGVYEIWSGGDESACIYPDSCNPLQYRLLTHTVYDKPMKLICRFYAPSFRAAKQFNDLLRDAGAFDD